MKITLKLNILIIYSIESERSTKEKLMVDIFLFLVRSIYNFFLCKTMFVLLYGLELHIEIGLWNECMSQAFLKKS